MNKHCHMCGDLFDAANATVNYCSRTCVNDAQRHREEQRIDRVIASAPLYPRSEVYDAVCTFCSRTQHEYRLSTDPAKRARQVALVGLSTRCSTPHCGGLVTLIPVAMGSLG